MLAQYEMNEYTTGDILPKRWLIEDDGTGNIRKIKSISTPYSNKDGEVVTYIDRSLIDTNATARRVQAQAEKQQGSIETELDRWLQAQETKCDD